MEGKLKSLNGDLANKSYLENLKSEVITKIPNGLRNGFKETKEKPVLQVYTNGYFDEISDDDFHLELDASDDENGSEDANNILQNTPKSESILEKAVNENNLKPPLPVDEIQDIQGINKIKTVPEGLNTSDEAEVVTLVDNNSLVIKLDSLLDCEKPVSSNAEQKEEEIIVEGFYTPASSNSNNTNEEIGVNVVFSEVVIENMEANSEKVNDSSLENESDKVENDNQSLNVIECKTDDINIVASLSAECIPETDLENSFEKGSSTNVESDLKKNFSESENVLNSLELLPSTKVDTDGVLMFSVENSGIVTETKSLGEMFLNSNDLEMVACESDSVSITATVDDDNRDKYENLNTEQDTNIPLESTINEKTDTNVKPTLTKSCSGEDFSLKDVTKSVVENFEDKKKSSFDNNDFSTIAVPTPSIIARNSGSTEEINSVKFSQEEKQNISSSHESLNTLNDPSRCLVLDELNSFSSVDERIDETLEKFSVFSEACEFEATEESNIEESNNDTLQTVIDVSESIESEETDLLEVSEPTTLAIESFGTINDDSTKLFSVEITQSVPKESTHIILNDDENVAEVDVQITASENTEVFCLPDEEDNEEIIHKNDDKVVNENVEEAIVSKQINSDVLDNGKAENVETELPKGIDNADDLSCKKEDIHCVNEITSAIDEDNEFKVVDTEVTNMDIEESEPIVLSNQGKVSGLLINDEMSESETKVVDTEVTNIDVEESKPTVLNNEDKVSGLLIEDEMSESETKVVGTEVTNMDVEESKPIVLKDEDKVSGLLIEDEMSESETKVVDTEVTNMDVEESKPVVLNDEDKVSGLLIKDEVSESETKFVINTDDKSVSSSINEETDLKIDICNNLNSVKDNETGNGIEEPRLHTTLLDTKSFSHTKDEKSEDLEDSEDISDWLIEEVTSKVVESKEFVNLMSDKTSIQSSDKLEVSREFEQSNKEIRNKDIHLVIQEADELKNIGSSAVNTKKRHREIEEDVADLLANKSNSTSDESEGPDTKRLKPEDEHGSLKIEDDDSVLNNTHIMHKDSVKSTSTLKRSNSCDELTPDTVKKIKLCSDEEEKVLTVCSDILEECLQFAENEGKVVDKDKVINNAPKLKNNSASDVSFIRDILKTTVETTDVSKSDINTNSNKFRRKEENNVLTPVDKEKKKKVTVPNKTKEESVKKSQTISNLDLAIERVVEESRKDPANRIPCLKKFHKDQLKELTRHDLEEVVIVKLCEAITDRSVIGELRQRCQKVEQNLEQWRKKAMQLEKSHREVEMVLKRYLQESSNAKKERQPLPIKVTRSVGLQVVLSHSSNSGRQKLNSQHMNQNKKQNAVPSKIENPLVAPKPASTPVVSGTSKTSRTSLSQAVPQQTQSGIKILPPKTSQVDLNSPPQKSSTSTTSVSSRNRQSTPTPVLPVNSVPTPKANNMEVIDLTDKEERSKQLQQKQQQLIQQQKLKRQLIQQQQQQKQKQQIIQQKQQQQKQLAQQQQQNQQHAKQIMQLKQVKSPSLQMQKPNQSPQSKQQSPQQNIAGRIPTTVSQNGIRLVQTHQLTSNSPTQSMAILVPNSAGQNGTTRTQHLLIATPTSNQLRTSVPLIRPNPTTTPQPTVMLKSGQVIPIQQPSPGVLRAPASTITTSAFPRSGLQPVRPQQSVPVYKHPAALPLNPQHNVTPGTKLPPPKPQLKIAKTVNGIMLSWSMVIGKEVAEISSYQLFAYQESSSQPPSTALWKKVGDVKALPLPMACTLTQFVEGHKYHFSVRAVDVHTRIGPFSVPGSILLTSGK